MYKILTQLNSFGNTQISIIKLNENGSFTSFPNDPTNLNYKAYQDWLNAGNTPEPANQGE
jgi:hypothetical protein